jgi:hypothetical protein
MFDAINYQVLCKSNVRPNFILHILCHPGLHFRSLSMKCDVMKGRLLAEGTVYLIVTTIVGTGGIKRMTHGVVRSASEEGDSKTRFHGGQLAGKG